MTVASSSAMRLLIAPDKFKGSLTSDEAASAIETGFRAVFPSLQAIRIPLADGGEGTAELFRRTSGGETVETRASDPLGRSVKATWTWFPDTREAVIDMSAASGLWRLADSERDPSRTSTRGTGELVLAAIARGAQRIFIGLGGSATNDAGAGLAAAFGYRFLDASGAEIEAIPANFLRITRVIAPATRPKLEIIALSDVTNPLLGSRGATRIYGHQKGAINLDELETSVAHLAAIIDRDLHGDHRPTPGAGAAGGLGYGLLTFLDAEIRPGFDACVSLLGIEPLIAEADLVITGEGRLDATTIDGKGPSGIARLARAAGKPCIAFAGVIEDSDAIRASFDACIPIAERPATLAESMASAGILLSHAAERVARLVALSKHL